MQNENPWKVIKKEHIFCTMFLNPWKISSWRMYLSNASVSKYGTSYNPILTHAGSNKSYELELVSGVSWVIPDPSWYQALTEGPYLCKGPSSSPRAWAPPAPTVLVAQMGTQLAPHLQTGASPGDPCVIVGFLGYAIISWWGEWDETPTAHLCCQYVWGNAEFQYTTVKGFVPGPPGTWNWH